MTCIVGMLCDGLVYMAGDHIGTDGSSKEIQKRSKVFKNGDFVIGYTSSFRMGQLLEHVWEPPKKQKTCKDITTYMVKYVVPSIMKLFEDNKFMSVTNESDNASNRSVRGQACGGVFLIGYKDRLFKIQSDFAVLECINGYDAIGAGEEYALGALGAIHGVSKDPTWCLNVALKSTEKHCALVSVDWNNFSVLSTGK